MYELSLVSVTSENDQMNENVTLTVFQTLVDALLLLLCAT